MIETEKALSTHLILILGASVFPIIVALCREDDLFLKMSSILTIKKQ